MHFFFCFPFSPKPVLHRKNTGDRRGGRKGITCSSSASKDLLPISKLPKKQQQLINLQHQVMVLKGTYAKHELIRQAGEL